MKKGIMVCCMTIIICLVGNVAYSYPVDVSFFFEGLTLETGETEQDPTVLVVIFGESDEIDQVIQPSSEIVDFGIDSGVDVYFKYAPEFTDFIQVITEHSMQYAIVDTTFDPKYIPDLSFQELKAGEFIEINPFNVLVLQATPFETFVMNFTHFDDLDLGLEIEHVVVPEPGTIGLLGLGIISVVGFHVLRRKKNTQIIKRSITFLSFMLVMGTSMLALGQQEGTFTVKKAGDGTGTVLLGEQTCASGCSELTIPYSPKTAIILKAIPDTDSIFVGWEKEDTSPVEGKMHATPSDVVVAWFTTAQPQQRPPVTYISFGEVAEDEAIVQLLERQNIDLEAALFWASGLSGIHRNDEIINPKTFIEEVRSEMTAMLTEASENIPLTLLEFVEQYDESQFIQSNALQEELRSLLNLWTAIENGLNDTEQGNPIIFAIEIDGVPEQFGTLLQEPIIKAIITNADETTTTFPATTPEAYQEEFVDQSIQDMSPLELYQKAKTLVYGSLTDI